tara:strand:- start:40 stop:1389 length:1350 start_codon:yes stop_codon:yes gene_type:complete
MTAASVGYRGFKTVWHVPVEIFTSHVKSSKTLKEISVKCGLKNGNNNPIVDRINWLNIDAPKIQNKLQTKKLRKKKLEWRETVQTECEKDLQSCQNTYVPTENEMQLLNYHDTILRYHVPNVVNQLLENPKEAVINSESFDFKGVVYIVYSHTMKNIIYIGSTRRFNKRKNNHKSKFLKSDTTTTFAKFITDNDLLDDIEFIPVLTCEPGYGFEVIMESELIKQCASLFPLQNDSVPLVSGITMQTNGVIYGLFLDGCQTPKYVGKSIKYYERVVKHMTNAYNVNNMEYDRKLYKCVRQHNDEHWPKNVNFKIIELAPIWMLDNRENHYMKMYKMKNTGWNSINNMSTQKDIEEEQLNHNKSNCQSNVVCPKCNKTICNKYKLVSHIEKCDVNKKVVQGTVTFIKRSNKWQARSPRDSNGTQKSLGCFHTKIDAEQVLNQYLIDNNLLK